MPITIDDIRKAGDLIEGSVVRTPSVFSPALTEKLGIEVALKLENMQVTGSFKPRGAMVKLSGLTDKEKKKGIVAASAGNHAQGVAYHAKHWQIPATIVMPTNTPFTKVTRTEALGAKIVLLGETLLESRAHADEIALKEGLTFIHPYDDEKIITGQGTVGLELLEDVPDLEALIIPIGGGGLAAGIAIAAKALNPDIELYGVESSLYPSMREALNGDEASSGGQTIADGIAVKAPGVLTRPIIEKHITDVFTVDERALEKAVQVYAQEQNIVTEGAGAASLAALMENLDIFRGRKTGLIVSGGNIDPRILSSILMRGLMHEGRIVQLRIEIMDQPGVLARVSGLIGECGGNIVEVYHQRMFYDLPIKNANVDVVVETVDPDHVGKIIARLTEAGFPTRLLSSTSDNIS